MVYLGFTIKHFDEIQKNELLLLTNDIDHLIKALIKSIDPNGIKSSN